jgi:DNA-binding transcriptional MerR regulator
MELLGGDGMEELDREWLNLILEAKKLGMTVEEVREFLAQVENSSVKK